MKAAKYLSVVCMAGKILIIHNISANSILRYTECFMNERLVPLSIGLVKSLSFWNCALHFFVIETKNVVLYYIERLFTI